MTELRSSATMSKKRYYDIEALVKATLSQHLDEAITATTLDAIMKGIQEIMIYDPTLKVYTPERGRRTMECRKKAREREAEQNA